MPSRSQCRTKSRMTSDVFFPLFSLVLTTFLACASYTSLCIKTNIQTIIIPGMDAYRINVAVMNVCLYCRETQNEGLLICSSRHHHSAMTSDVFLLLLRHLF